MELDALEDKQASLSQPLDMLRRVFGHDRFRPLQDQVIHHVTAGRDAVVLMPTGAGKSLCYQVPALCRPGTAVIVSPLIALMRDQTATLQAKGVRAACLHAGLTPEETRDVLASLRGGTLDLLYVAPERAVLPAFLSELRAARVALIAIDEAHCVVQWGPSFRPAYLELGRLFAHCPETPRLALTGTADPAALAEIQRVLWLEGARVFRAGIARPNVTLSVAQQTGNRRAFAHRLVQRAKGACLLYTRSRRRATQVAKQLQEAGLPALAYHAGLAAEERRTAEHHFLTEEDPVIVATVAFGMGLDRPDIRLVGHLDLPDSLTAYWQEVGRAGRDGAPAQAVTAYGLTPVLEALRRSLGTTTPQSARQLTDFLTFMETDGCRAQAVQHHFGESGADPCGQCDRCRDPIARVDVSEPVGRLLVTLDRMGGSMGPNRLIAALDGAAQEVFWRSLMRQALVKGLLAPEEVTSYALRLSDAGREALTRHDTIVMNADWRGAGDPHHQAGSAPADACLTRLQAVRVRLASAHRIPPMLICHDRALQALARERPRTLEDLARIPGLSGALARDCGDAFLEALSQAETDPLAAAQEA